jgi:hypothetical protein
MKFLMLIAVIAMLVAGSALFVSNDSRAASGSMHVEASAPASDSR